MKTIVLAGVVAALISGQAPAGSRVDAGAATSGKAAAGSRVDAGAATSGKALPGSRVVLDRLTWCPDRRHLAVEATCECAEGTFRDTLVVDLEEGALSMRTVRPRRIAFDERTGALVAADRYSLLYGSTDRPEAARLLCAWNPVSGTIDRLGFTPAGDSVLIQSHPEDLAWYDITAISVGTGRQRLIYRLSTPAASDSTWTRLGAGGQATTVQPIPFSTFYLIAGSGVLHLERSERGPAAGGEWTYDLHRRDSDSGDERIIARGLAPWATATSPDGQWVALAGAVSRPDYGGGSRAALSVLSTDGKTYFTVEPERVRTDAPVPVTAMAWHRGALWYLTADGVFRLDPRFGRSSRVSIGPPPAAWSDSLGPPAMVRTLVLPDTYDDSTAAVDLQEKLRRADWPAWVMGNRSGPFRVAVGAVEKIEDLEELAVHLSRRGIDDFQIDSVFASRSGVPFPHGRVTSPDRAREAYLTEVGPPGFRAGELWVSEQHGARQIRLIRAMLRLDRRVAAARVGGRTGAPR